MDSTLSFCTSLEWRSLIGTLQACWEHIVFHVDASSTFVVLSFNSQSQCTVLMTMQSCFLELGLGQVSLELLGISQQCLVPDIDIEHTSFFNFNRLKAPEKPNKMCAAAHDVETAPVYVEVLFLHVLVDVMLAEFLTKCLVSKFFVCGKKIYVCQNPTER